MDARLATLAMGVWSAAAIFVSVGLRLAPQAILFAITSAVLAAMALIHRQRQQWLMLALGVALGSAVAMLRIWPLIHHPLYSAARSTPISHIRAVVTGDPIVFARSGALDWNSRTSVVVPLRVTAFDVHGQRVRGAIPISAFSTPDTSEAMANLIPGMHVNLTARLSPATAGRPVAATATVVSLQIERGPSRYQGFASTLRQGLHRTLEHSSPDAQMLVPGLALGDSSALQPDLKQAMQSAGLTHLIAVSGANVSLLVLIVMRICVHRSRTTQLVVVLLVLAAFVILVRPQPSVLRASVMGMIVVLAHFRGTRAFPFPALATAIIVLISIDPWLSISYGFALSIFATGGLILFSPKLVSLLDRWLPRQIPRWFVSTLTVTLCAQFAVLPLMISLSAPISLASIPANVIAVPLAAPAMVFGLLAAVLSVVSSPLALVIAQGAIWPAVGIAWVARWGTEQTWLTVPWPHGIWGVGLAIGFMALTIHGALLWRRLPSIAHTQLVATIMCFVFLLWQPPSLQFRPWPPANWIMVVCDVGQGDGTVIRVGTHSAVVIDVGPDPQSMNRCLDRLHISRIPLLVLSHFHADHVGGLEAVLQGRSVGQVWTSTLQEPELTTAFALRVLQKHGLQEHVATFPEHVVLGDLDIQCLWPARLIRSQGSDPNNASIVLLIRTRGHELLLAGDVEPPAQQAIAHQFGSLNVDVLKIAHHGSPHQDSGFAVDVHPRVAIISVGENNDYGHPAQSTIAMYEALGSTVWRTDRQGSIAVVESDGQLAVRPSRGS